MQGLCSLLLLCGAARWALAQVSQPPRLTALEGGRLHISCNHNITPHQRMYWYRQPPQGQGAPIFLGSGYDGTSPAGELTMEVYLASRSSTLSRDGARLQDAGIYYCATEDPEVGGSGAKLIFGKGTKLSVELNLPDSIPFVYKLESSKASISACLITDYFPDDIIITDHDGLNKSFQSSIVEVKDPGSNTKEASYGTVYWFQSDFQGDIKYGLDYKSKCRESAEDEEETCTTMEMSHDFETDEHLNLLSFMVLGMKVVFLKGVTCNLLVTFLAWKS